MSASACSRLRMLWHQSCTVVMPAATAPAAAKRVLWYMSSGDMYFANRVMVGKKPLGFVSPMKLRKSVCHMCQCVSISPGRMIMPDASMVGTPGRSITGATSRITPSLTWTAPTGMSPRCGSIVMT